MKKRLPYDVYADAKKYLYAALYYKLSEPGCNNSFGKAIKVTPNKLIKRYIEKE